MASDGQQMPGTASSDEPTIKPSAGFEVSQKPEEVPPEASLAPPMDVLSDQNATMSVQQPSDASLEASGSPDSSSKVANNSTETEQPLSQTTRTKEPTGDSSDGTFKDGESPKQTSDLSSAFVVPHNGIFQEYNAFKAAQIERREADGSASGNTLGPPAMSPNGGVAVAPEMPPAQPISGFGTFQTLFTNQEDQTSQGTHLDSASQVTEDAPAVPVQSAATAAKTDAGEIGAISGTTGAPAERAAQTSAQDEAIIAPIPSPTLLAASANPNNGCTNPTQPNTEIPSTAAPDAENPDLFPSAVPMKQAVNEEASTMTATPATRDQHSSSSEEPDPSVLPHSTTTTDSAPQTAQQLQSAESTMSKTSQLVVSSTAVQSSDSSMAATRSNLSSSLEPSATFPDGSSTNELHPTTQQEQPQTANIAENNSIIPNQDSQERTAAAAISPSAGADKLAMSREPAASMGASATSVNEPSVMNLSQDIPNEQSQAAGAMLQSLEEDTTISESFRTQAETTSPDVGAPGLDSIPGVTTSTMPAESYSDNNPILGAQDGQSLAIGPSSTISTETEATAAPMPPPQDISAFGLLSADTSQSVISNPNETQSVALDQSDPTATESMMASMAPMQESAQPIPSSGDSDQSSISTGMLLSDTADAEPTVPQMPPVQDISSFGQSVANTNSPMEIANYQPSQTLATATTAAPMPPAQDMLSFSSAAAGSTPTDISAAPEASQLSAGESTVPDMPPAQDIYTFADVTQLTDVYPPSSCPINTDMQPAQPLDSFVVLDQMPGRSLL